MGFIQWGAQNWTVGLGYEYQHPEHMVNGVRARSQNLTPGSVAADRIDSILRPPTDRQLDMSKLQDRLKQLRIEMERNKGESAPMDHLKGRINPTRQGSHNNLPRNRVNANIPRIQRTQ